MNQIPTSSYTWEYFKNTKLKTNVYIYDLVQTYTGFVYTASDSVKPYDHCSVDLEGLVVSCPSFLLALTYFLPPWSQGSPTSKKKDLMKTSHLEL